MSGNLTILSDVFSEGVSGQFIDLTLIDPTTSNTVNTAAVTAATATLRSLDTGNTVFASANVLPSAPSSRGSYPGGGVLRLTFTSADMASIGNRELQGRELVVDVEHSGGKHLKHAIQFRLSNTGEV